MRTRINLTLGSLALGFFATTAMGQSDPVVQHPNLTTNAAPAADKWKFNLFHPTPDNLMRGFQSDRPSKTDVPYTVDAGHFQLETDVLNYTHDAGGGISTETWQAGSSMNLKLGLLNNTDLQLILGNYVRQQVNDHNLGTRTVHEGFGDITTRLKVNLWGNDGGATALAVLPYWKLPTDTGGTGNHSNEGGVNIPFSASLPMGFTLGVETGVGAFRNSDNSDYHAAFNNSIIFYHTIVGQLSGYAEFWSSVSSRSSDPWMGTADFGLLYQLEENVSLDVNTAIGLTRSAPDYNVFGGFSVRF